MIRRLRRTHRVVFAFLALGIPILLTRAFASRPLAPLSAPPLPPAGTINASDLTASWLTQLGALRYRLVPGAADSPGSIALGPATALRAPDLLVYWTRRDAPLSTIEDGDRLLGRLDAVLPVVIVLPPAASDSSGTLVLYSLAHRSVVGTLELPAAQGSRP
jgi:hypothetical protein